MKRIISLFLVCGMCMCLLCSCGQKVNSLEGARTILLQATSDLSEIKKDVSDREKLTEKELEAYKDKLSDCREKIDLSEDYCVDEMIKEKYDSAEKLYKSVEKIINKFEKKLEEEKEQESKKGK